MSSPETQEPGISPSDEAESPREAPRSEREAPPSSERDAEAPSPSEEGSSEEAATEQPKPRVQFRWSPSVVALVGALAGIATVLGVIAIVIHVDPERPASAPSMTAPASSPAPPPPKAAAVAPSAKPAPQKIAGPWRVADLAGDPGYRIVRGEIGREPFLKVLQDKGLDKSQAYAAFDALKSLRDLNKCGSDDQFVAAIDRASKKLHAFEYVASKEEIYQARADTKGALVAKRLDLHVETTEVRAAFAYDGKNLDDSASAAGLGPGLRSRLEAALGARLDFGDLHPGDVFRVIVEEVYVLGEFSRHGTLEAVEYRPASGDPARYYQFRDSHGQSALYDSKGKAPGGASGGGGWAFPLPGAHVTSAYNLHRMHPILHKIMPHLGTDIGAPVGTPVHASSFGVVERLSGSGATGNLVMLEHADGIETGYAHLSRFAAGIKVGAHVARMQVVGYVGSTGRSTGPHLHWIAKKDGKFFDAMTLRPDSVNALASEDQPAFQAAKQKYDVLLDAIALPAVTPSSAEAPRPVASAASTATAAPAAEEGDTDDTEDKGALAEGSAPADRGVPTPGQPTPTRNPVYMSDKELLHSQPASDDGEVAE